MSEVTGFSTCNQFYTQTRFNMHDLFTLTIILKDGNGPIGGQMCKYLSPPPPLKQIHGMLSVFAVHIEA